MGNLALQLTSVITDTFLVIVFTLFPSLWKNIDGVKFVLCCGSIFTSTLNFSTQFFFSLFFFFGGGGRGVL